MSPTNSIGGEGQQAMIQGIKDKKSGPIINVASIAGHKGRPAGVVYAATKQAVRAIAEGLRQAVKPYNIRSSTIISPRMVATELFDSIAERDIADVMHRRYEGAVSAESFARIVAFAISQPDEVDINEIRFRPTSQEY